MAVVLGTFACSPGKGVFTICCVDPVRSQRTETERTLRIAWLEVVGTDSLSTLLSFADLSTLPQFSAGRLEVREGDARPELRAHGLVNQQWEWQPFSTTSE